MRETFICEAVPQPEHYSFVVLMGEQVERRHVLVFIVELVYLAPVLKQVAEYEGRPAGDEAAGGTEADQFRVFEDL